MLSMYEDFFDFSDAYPGYSFQNAEGLEEIENLTAFLQSSLELT